MFRVVPPANGAVSLTVFWGRFGYRKKGTLILTPLVEDLGGGLEAWRICVWSVGFGGNCSRIFPEGSNFSGTQWIHLPAVGGLGVFFVLDFRIFPLLVWIKFRSCCFALGCF